MHNRRIRPITAAALLAVAVASGAAAQSVRTTPSANEMTPAQWRAQQLAAADRSDSIMRDAQKQQGLLGQYGHMQLAYDANHDRAFQLIFGQYLTAFWQWILVKGDIGGDNAHCAGA